MPEKNHIFHDEPFAELAEDGVWDRAISIRRQVEELLEKYPAGTVVEFFGMAANQWKWANAVFDEASRVSA